MPIHEKGTGRFTPSQMLVLGFAGLIVVGTILLLLPISHEPGKSIGFVDALFTATSAVCVTGLAVVDAASQFSTFGELVILCLIQAGGLGIMTLSAMMMMLWGKRISLRERLALQHALGSFSIAGVVRFTQNIILGTLAIEATGALLLTLHWLPEYPWPQALYWGVFHSVSAFNNAGFDLTSASLKPFSRDPFVLLVIGLLIIMGGIGFMVLEDVWKKRRWADLTLHSRLVIRVSGWMLAVGTVAILVLEFSNPKTLGAMPWVHKITNALFAAITPRTAGFESVATGSFFDSTLLLMGILMFIGASPGGTGGGIKTSTVSLIALTVQATARGKDEIQLMGRRLPKDLVDKSLAVVAIAALVVAGGTLLLLVTEGAALADSSMGLDGLRVLFEVLSAFGTVGLTTGLTPHLTTIGRILIVGIMFIGRVGPLTMAVALADRKREHSAIHYPEDRVIIG